MVRTEKCQLRPKHKSNVGKTSMHNRLSTLVMITFLVQVNHNYHMCSLDKTKLCHNCLLDSESFGCDKIHTTPLAKKFFCGLTL